MSVNVIVVVGVAPPATGDDAGSIVDVEKNVDTEPLPATVMTGTTETCTVPISIGKESSEVDTAPNTHGAQLVTA